MSGGGFDDAFAEDPDGLERDRRRARRAAGRHERQARRHTDRPERLQGEAAAAPPAAAGPEQAEPVATPREPVASVTDGPSRRERPLVAAATGRGPSDGTIRTRRLLAAVALLVVALGAYLAVNAIADRLGGSGASDVTENQAATAGPGKVFDVTVPEGLDRSQTADVVAEAGLEGDYEQASVETQGFDPGRYGAEDPDSLEGFLFPATYEIPKREPTVEELVAQQTQAFSDYFSGVDLGYARSKNLTPYDVVIIASMIEEEISVASERPLAAAVIYNRLSQGMPLGIDATVRYATGNYDSPLTESELETDSPYNTRINSGLPPGPISNPGLASLKAAAKPAKVDYLYYVIEPGTCNRHVFTASEAEFTQAAAEYQAALEAEGGSPTSC